MKRVRKYGMFCLRLLLEIIWVYSSVMLFSVLGVSMLTKTFASTLPFESDALLGSITMALCMDVFAYWLLPIVIICVIAVFLLCHSYRMFWRYLCRIFV